MHETSLSRFKATIQRFRNWVRVKRARMEAGAEEAMKESSADESGAEDATERSTDKQNSDTFIGQYQYSRRANRTVYFYDETGELTRTDGSDLAAFLVETFYDTSSDYIEKRKAVLETRQAESTATSDSVEVKHGGQQESKQDKPSREISSMQRQKAESSPRDSERVFISLDTEATREIFDLQLHELVDAIHYSVSQSSEDGGKESKEKDVKSAGSVATAASTVASRRALRQKQLELRDNKAMLNARVWMLLNGTASASPLSGMHLLSEFVLLRNDPDAVAVWHDHNLGLTLAKRLLDAGFPHYAYEATEKTLKFFPKVSLPLSLSYPFPSLLCNHFI